jgi:hypothetical protein
MKTSTKEISAAVKHPHYTKLRGEFNRIKILKVFLGGMFCINAHNVGIYPEDGSN